MPQSAIHRYGTHSSQLGDIYLPDRGGPWPVAVVLHGGFWRARYDRRLMDALCADLARRGWAVWSVEYRRLGLRSGGGWPATLLDVAAGIDHLAVLAAGGVPLELGRVAAIGHSAGGHLALWAAARPGLPHGAPGADPQVRVTHAVSQAGVADLVEAARLGLGAGVVTRLLGGPPGRRMERYAVASPAARLPLRVPQLLVHGDEDDTVPVAMARAYHEAATAAGDRVDLAVYPGGHFEHLDPQSGAWAAVVEWLRATP